VDNVLGLARTEFIFTRIQEGTQTGGLTQPGQTEQDIPYHVLSCWVRWGGPGGRELSCVLGGRGTGPGERLSGSCGLCCVFSLSVSLLLLFPLFAVLLNCPYPDPPVFCLFLPILPRTPAGGGAAAWPFCYQSQLKYNTASFKINIVVIA